MKFFFNIRVFVILNNFVFVQYADCNSAEGQDPPPHTHTHTQTPTCVLDVTLMVRFQF